MTVATISFEGPALNWYRSQEEWEKFVSPISIHEGGIVIWRIFRYTTENNGGGIPKFVRQMGTTFSDLPEKVVEETFMSRLMPWIQVEMDF